MIAAALVALAADTNLALNAVRFYRADPGRSPGQTHVTAFIRIPPDLPVPGAQGEVSLRLTIRVVDSTDRALYQQSWTKRTTVPAPRGEADRLESFRFTLGPGRYRLEASAVDSVSGRRAQVSVPIEGYAAPPLVSDMMLAPWARPVAAVDTVPHPGEFRRGGLILAAAPNVVVGGDGATVAYLLETYSGTALDGSLELTVVDPSGAPRKEIGATAVRLVAGIGLLTGEIEVGDLGPGSFRLRSTLSVGDQPIVREASFEVDPAAGSVPAALSDEAYFAGLDREALDRAFAPLAAIGSPAELRGWPANGSADAKREFLVAFWRKRDPDPESGGDERRAQFYDGVTYANAFYPDPLRRLPGWQTDRGRIFLRAGVPTQVLRRERRGRVPAYEVWRYFERAPRFYVFVDQPGVASYRLVRSNDPNAAQERRWQEILTPTGVREVVEFLGREVLGQ